MVLFASALLLLLGGCASQTGLVRGVAPGRGAVTPIRDLTAKGGQTLVAGRMVEKCPVAGCWFRLQDKTGVIKVDTKGAGFVVSDIPVGSQIQVIGTLKTVGERRFEAVGIRAQ